MSKKWYTRTKRWARICAIAVALLLIMATAHAANTYTVSMVTMTTIPHDFTGDITRLWKW